MRTDAVTAAAALGILAMLAALALPAAAAGAAPGATWRFEAPVTAGGSLAVATDGWLLLLAEPGATFDLGLPPAATTNHTTAWLRPDATSSAGWPLPDAADSLGPVRARVTFLEGGSLLLAAERLEVTLDGSAEFVATAAGAAPMGGVLPEDAGARGAARLGAHASDGAGVAARTAAPSPPVGVRVSASGLRLLEWHGARVDCATAACPDGARTARAGGLAPVAAELVPYLEVRPGTPGGALVGGGTALAVAVGGERMDVAADGWVRLPAARQVPATVQGSFDPAGATIYAEGDVALADLHPDTEGGGLEAQVSGSGLRVRAGETWLPAPAAVAGAAAAAGLGLAWVAVKTGWALAARVLGGKAGEHPARQRLLEVAAVEPGLGLREACRRAGVPYATGVHHLAILRRARLVVLVRQGRRLLLCLPGAERKALAAAPARDALRAGGLLEAVNARTMPFQGDLIAHARDQWGWPASTTRHRLARLVEAGLVERRRLGARVAYVPAEDRQAPAFPAAHPVTPTVAPPTPASSS